MSLSRVLVLIMSFLLLLVLMGTFGISVNNSRRFLEEQLAGHAQDTATSLGLSLSISMGALDIAAAESLVDAIFDRGYYRQIIIRSADKKIFIERWLPIQVKDVPSWFIRLIPMETLEGKAQVMSGWQPSGNVLVKSHPGYAYAELWRNLTGIFWCFLTAWVTGTFLIIGILHVLLSHLRGVEAQAIAVSNREFPVLEKLPWSRELRKVVNAMNMMSKKLKTVFQDQADFIESLRHEAYQDPVTGLANRRHFESRLKLLIDDFDEFTRGVLLLIQIENFKEYNQRYGHKAGDNLLKDAAASIAAVCRKDAAEHIAARLNGTEFAVLAWGGDESGYETIADTILKELGHLYLKTDSPQPFVFHCGVAGYTGSETASQLFTKADTALRNAQSARHTVWFRFPDTDSTSESLYTADRLRSLLNRRLKHGDIALSLEPVVSCSNAKLVHYEVLARIKDEAGHFLPAWRFIKLAEQMNCAPELDKIMVKSVLDHMENRQGSTEAFAVNLSPSSLRDEQFIDWLIHTLRNVSQYAGRMTFESIEYPCVAILESVRPSIGRIIDAGSSFALDHFGVGSASFGYLMDLKLAYLKIDGSYIRQISENRDHQFFVQAITNIAHGLDIQMIACHVERQQEFDKVKMLGVDAVQGKLLCYSSHPLAVGNITVPSPLGKE